MTKLGKNIFLDVIVTFDGDREQDWYQIHNPSSILAMMADKDYTIQHFEEDYDDVDITKVSMALCNCSEEAWNVLSSEWFDQANGKLWVDDFHHVDEKMWNETIDLKASLLSGSIKGFN